MGIALLPPRSTRRCGLSPWLPMIWTRRAMPPGWQLTANQSRLGREAENAWDEPARLRPMGYGAATFALRRLVDPIRFESSEEKRAGWRLVHIFLIEGTGRRYV